MAAAAYLVALLAIPDARTARYVPAAAQGGDPGARATRALRRLGLSSSLSSCCCSSSLLCSVGLSSSRRSCFTPTMTSGEWPFVAAGARHENLRGRDVSGWDDAWRTERPAGPKPVIIVGMVLYSAQFFGLATFRSAVPIVAAFVVAGLGNALFDPTLSASVLEHSPAEHRTSILGIKSMVGSAGTILGSALISALSTTLEARSAFLIAGAAVLLVTAVGVSERERRTPSHST